MDETKQLDRPYPELENLELDELANLLRQDFYESDDMDMGYAMAILGVIERREKENTKIKQFDVETGLKNFKENYMGKSSDYISIATHENPSSETTVNIPRPQNNKKRSLSRRIAVAAVLVVLLGAMSAHALGYNLLNIVAQWTADVFGFRITVSESNTPLVLSEIPPDMQFTSIQHALDYIGITYPVAPTWIPDGFSQTSLSVVPMPDWINIFAFFEDGNRTLSIQVMVFYEEPDDNAVLYEKDDNPVIQYESGGLTHYIMTNNSRLVSVWINGNLECSIDGDISEAEIKQMIDSIYGG